MHKMRPIVTAVAWSVCLSVCVLNITVSCATTAPPTEMTFGMWTSDTKGTMVKAQTPQWKGQFWGDIFQPIAKYRGYLACNQYSQSYSISGSSDADVCCQCAAISLHFKEQASESMANKCDRCRFHTHTHTHTHTCLTALFPGLPGRASTRKVKPIWILLKQETVSGSGISWAICKSVHCSRQTTTPASHHSCF